MATRLRVNQYITKTHATQSSKVRQINSSDRPSESATHFYRLRFIALSLTLPKIRSGNLSTVIVII